ncbi:AraC family transcriptional regulator [Paraburkholderia phosphatilytica]|uniref:AraC family transcriptional regulator n=1 Tax=Paraburkholderia phosphatilytica TaxID=2282883 RepID=UPI000E51DA4C|nr:AraC family transcriptional regulator [Paraburkholderia phosphatilytica]
MKIAPPVFRSDAASAAGVPIPFATSRASLRSSGHLGWNGFGAELIGLRAGARSVPAAMHHRIGVHVGLPSRVHCTCEGRRITRLQAQGDVDVIPAGYDGTRVDDNDSVALRVWLTDAFVARTFEQADPAPPRLRIDPHFQLRDRRFELLAWALRAELEADDASDALYAESLCTAMVVRLVNADDPFAPQKRRRTLAARTAARVIDYVESHLDRPLTLTELAALSGLSVPHFKVLFRETLGMPVHRYVIARRVERARVLLLDGRLGVEQVALETGFAHPSHLAHWTRRLLGATPAGIRASRSKPSAPPIATHDAGDPA